MRKAVFIVRAVTWVWAENEGYTHKIHENTFSPRTFSMHGMHTSCPCAWIMP